MLATKRQAAGATSLKVLWVATKAPWPPIDGGRRLMWETLQALAPLPVDVTLVSPVSNHERTSVEEALRPLCTPELVSGTFHRRPSWLRIALRFGLSLTARKPMSAWRHRNSGSCERVRRLLAERSFDLVHVEQPQAFEVLPDGPLPPVLLRAQNVESDLWKDLAGHRRGPLGMALSLEAARIKRWEAATLARATIVAAVSKMDQRRLETLTGLASERFTYLPAPFPAPLEPSSTHLPGDPALVVFGGSGWLLSELGARHFVDRVWASVARRHPAARLHVFGAPIKPHRARPAVDFHPAPDDSQTVFAKNAVLLVPLHVSSGVRIKILEAWSRSCPVVASRVATDGLGEGGNGALVVVEDMDSPADWVTALERLASAPDVQEMRARGLGLVQQHHAPAAVAEQLFELYLRASGREPSSTLVERSRADRPDSRREDPRQELNRRIGDAAFEAER